MVPQAEHSGLLAVSETAAAVFLSLLNVVCAVRAIIPTMFTACALMLEYV